MLHLDSKLLEILIQATSFISTFASIAAAVIMYEVTKKFGTGILAGGFKTISVGVVFLSIGISMNVAELFADGAGVDVLSALFRFLEGLFFIVGTYVIVIGSKRTADKLETLTK